MGVRLKMPWRCLAGLLLAAAGGCAEGPLFHMAKLNPVIRKQWSEDELYQTTLHTKLEELKAVRTQAASMTQAEQSEWIALLADLVRDEPNALVRAGAVRALAEFKSPQANAPLEAALQDANRTVRIAACEAWGRRPNGAGLLTGVIGSDTELDVRLTATRQLAHFPNDQLALQGLTQALNDDDPAMQYRATETLRSVTHADYGNNVAAWRQYLETGTAPESAIPSVVERIQRWF